MRQCRNCKKQIPDGKEFCSNDCYRKYYLNKAENERNRANSQSIFWHKGEGMDRRCHNINIIKQLIKQGLSYKQIFRQARKYFTSKIFNEYYDIAIDEIRNPLNDSEDSVFSTPQKEADRIIEKLEREKKDA